LGKCLALFFVFFISGEAFGSQGKTEACEWNRKSYVYSNSDFSLRVAEYLTPENSDKIIVMLPPTGGTTPLDTATAKYFCKRGVSTVILDRWTGYIKQYEVNNLFTHQKELDDAKRALIGLVNGVYKDRKIGIFGVSKGAIGATAFKDDFRSNVKSLFLVAAGAPLHLTISRAGASVLRELREERLLFYNINQFTYDNWIDETVTHYTRERKNSIKLAMVISNSDTVVPSQLQHNLFRRWRPDKYWTTEVDHFRTILTTHLNLKDEAFEFFMESF
jgi:hypothetical protein